MDSGSHPFLRKLSQLEIYLPISGDWSAPQQRSEIHIVARYSLPVSLGNPPKSVISVFIPRYIINSNKKFNFNWWNWKFVQSAREFLRDFRYENFSFGCIFLFYCLWMWILGFPFPFQSTCYLLQSTLWELWIKQQTWRAEYKGRRAHNIYFYFCWFKSIKIYNNKFCPALIAGNKKTKLAYSGSESKGKSVKRFENIRSFPSPMPKFPSFSHGWWIENTWQGRWCGHFLRFRNSGTTITSFWCTQLCEVLQRLQCVQIRQRIFLIWSLRCHRDVNILRWLESAYVILEDNE